MYMFFWFFKQLFYALKRVFKHTFLLLFIFFILFLIFFCNKSKAFYVGSTNWIDPPTQVINVLKTIPEYSDNQHYWFVFGVNGYHICTFPKPSNFKAFGKSPRYFSTNSSFTYKQYEINFSYNITGTITDTVTSSAEWGFGQNGDGTVYYLSNFPLYDYYNQNNLIYDGYSVDIDPYISTSSSSIENWTFDYLTINCGTLPTSSSCWLQWDYGNDWWSFNDMSSYKTIDNTTLIYNIPRSDITNTIVIRDGASITFSLNCRVPVERWYSSFTI